MPSMIAWFQFNLRRMAAVATIACAMHGLHAQQAGTKITQATPIVVGGLGKGTFPLDGPWQFHAGDNPAWASPAFDSSDWQQLTADRPWGRQVHERLVGFAWYRCFIAPNPAPGLAPHFSLLVPRVDDAYEVYWNGILIGRNGELPPHPVWYTLQPPQTFDLGQARQGVLAFRVWKAPLLSDDSVELGGFKAAPSIGSPEAIATAQAASEYKWLRSRQVDYGANLLCGVIALLSLLLWLRTPWRWVLFWTACFTIAPPAILLLLEAHIAWPYPLAMGAAQPLSAMQDVSLWFLLVWLLHIHENRAIYRLTRILAWICMINASLDGVMVAICWEPRWTRIAQVTDDASTALYILLEALPLVLVSYAILKRKHLDSARWMLAILAFADEMIIVFRNTIKQGRQFTDWGIAFNIDAPLFTIHGSAISLYTLAGALLPVAIVYAVYSSVREDQRRQDALEREKAELLHESKRMRHHAEHDGLTGLWNHRVIVERLGEEMDRSLREGRSLSVILIDVDHFKKINDSYGHVTGDLVLREIGAIFMRTLRSYDCVGRYGGEEFLLILPNCEIETALDRAEQLRRAVQSARIMDGEIMLQVTASFGVAAAFPLYNEADAVIRAVDTALYRAKSSGRNCVARADGEGDMPQLGSLYRVPADSN